MSDPEQTPSSVRINNEAPNLGAQGEFRGPVYFFRSLADRDRFDRDKRNRTRMLAKVRAFWITDVLEQALHGVACIALRLQEQSDAIANPWRLVIQESNQPAHLLPQSIHITQVYDDAGGELLILGEPGSGKTTLLLQLARDLLDRAEKDESLPMPAVFNLFSWAVKRQPLADWLVEELNRKYQVPHKLAQEWIGTDQILPLLDGVDEVPQEHRATCITAINTYRREHGIVPTVVCSRSTDYFTQSARLVLRNAVIVQPLTLQQIDSYLASAGEKLAVVRVALHADPILQELATTPLMLSVLALAYVERSVDDPLVAGSLQARRQQLFTVYIRRMFERRKAKSRYPLSQTAFWLAWLAEQLGQHSQTEFYIEQIQPNWLSESKLNRTYHTIIACLFVGLLGWLLSWLIGMLFSFLFSTGRFSDLIFGLSFGLVCGLLSLSVNRKKKKRKPTEVVASPQMSVWRRLIKVKLLGIGLFAGLLTGLGDGIFRCLRLGQLQALSALDTIGVLLNIGRDSSHLSGFMAWGMSGGLINGLVSGLVFGLFGGLIIELLGVPIDGEQLEIKPAEIIGWSWANMWRSLIEPKHLAFGFGGGLAFGLLVGFASSTLVTLFSESLSVELKGSPDWRFFGLVNGLLVGLSIYLLSGLLGGLSSEMLDPHVRIKPNQGIWRSARNGLLIGLVVMLMTGLIFGLANKLVANLLWPNVEPTGVLYPGLVFGLVFGVISALLSGGATCIEHIVLRLFLWSANLISWNYPRFLDYAGERVLLRKVGGGYIFLHKMLQEYFVTLKESLLSLQKDEKQRINQSQVCGCRYQDDRINAAQFCPRCGKLRMKMQAENIRDILSVPVLKEIVARNQWKKRIFKGSPFVIMGTLFAIIVLIVLWSVPILPLHTYPPSLHANLVLDDSLKSSNNHWYETIAPNGNTCRVTGEGYQVSSLSSRLWDCPDRGLNFSNFTFEVQMKIVKGGGGGFIFHLDERSGAFYAFVITTEGDFFLQACKSSGATVTACTTLAQGRRLAIHEGLSQSNLIAIVAQSNTFELYVNHQFIASATDKDNTSTAGDIALTATAGKPPVEVLYDNAKVWTVRANR